jgi:uncharacterized surface anchored protein
MILTEYFGFMSFGAELNSDDVIVAMNDAHLAELNLPSSDIFVKKLTIPNGTLVKSGIEAELKYVPALLYPGQGGSGINEGPEQLWYVKPKSSGTPVVSYCLIPHYHQTETTSQPKRTHDLNAGANIVYSTVIGVGGPNFGLGIVNEGFEKGSSQNAAIAKSYTELPWYASERNYYSSRADLYSPGSVSMYERGSYYEVTQKTIRLIQNMNNINGLKDFLKKIEQAVSDDKLLEYFGEYPFSDVVLKYYKAEIQYLLKAGFYRLWLEKSAETWKLDTKINVNILNLFNSYYTDDREGIGQYELVENRNLTKETTQKSGAITVNIPASDLIPAGIGNQQYVAYGPFDALSLGLDRRIEVGFDFGEENINFWKSTTPNIEGYGEIPSADNKYWMIETGEKLRSALSTAKALGDITDLQVNTLVSALPANAPIYITGRMNEYMYDGSSFADHTDIPFNKKQGSADWNVFPATFVTNSYSPPVEGLQREEVVGGNFYVMVPKAVADVMGSNMPIALKAGTRYTDDVYVYIGESNNGNPVENRNSDGVGYQAQVLGTTMQYSSDVSRAQMPVDEVYIKKQDDRGNILSGAQFEVKVFNPVTGKFDTARVLDETETGTFGPLREGMYIVQETVVPPNYSSPDIMSRLDVEDLEEFKSANFYGIDELDDWSGQAIEDFFPQTVPISGMSMYSSSAERVSRAIDENKDADYDFLSALNDVAEEYAEEYADGSLSIDDLDTLAAERVVAEAVAEQKDRDVGGLSEILSDKSAVQTRGITPMGLPTRTVYSFSVPDGKDVTVFALAGGSLSSASSIAYGESIDEIFSKLSYAGYVSPASGTGLYSSTTESAGKFTEGSHSLNVSGLGQVCLYVSTNTAHEYILLVPVSDLSIVSIKPVQTDIYSTFIENAVLSFSGGPSINLVSGKSRYYAMLFNGSSVDVNLTKGSAEIAALGVGPGSSISEVDFTANEFFSVDCVISASTIGTRKIGTVYEVAASAKGMDLKHSSVLGSSSTAGIVTAGYGTAIESSGDLYVNDTSYFANSVLFSVAQNRVIAVKRGNRGGYLDIKLLTGNITKNDIDGYTEFYVFPATTHGFVGFMKDSDGDGVLSSGDSPGFTWESGTSRTNLGYVNGVQEISYYGSFISGELDYTGTGITSLRYLVDSGLKFKIYKSSASGLSEIGNAVSGDTISESLANSTGLIFLDVGNSSDYKPDSGIIEKFDESQTYTVELSLYYDKNLNGIKDVGENWLDFWGVELAKDYKVNMVAYMANGLALGWNSSSDESVRPIEVYSRYTDSSGHTVSAKAVSERIEKIKIDGLTAGNYYLTFLMPSNAAGGQKLVVGNTTLEESFWMRTENLRSGGSVPITSYRNGRIILPLEIGGPEMRSTSGVTANLREVSLPVARINDSLGSTPTTSIPILGIDVGVAAEAGEDVFNGLFKDGHPGTQWPASIKNNFDSYEDVMFGVEDVIFSTVGAYVNFSLRDLCYGTMGSMISIPYLDYPGGNTNAKVVATVCDLQEVILDGDVFTQASLASLRSKQANWMSTETADSGYMHWWSYYGFSKVNNAMAQFVIRPDHLDNNGMPQSYMHVNMLKIDDEYVAEGRNYVEEDTSLDTGLVSVTNFFDRDKNGIFEGSDTRNLTGITYTLFDYEMGLVGTYSLGTFALSLPEGIYTLKITNIDASLESSGTNSSVVGASIWNTSSTMPLNAEYSFEVVAGKSVELYAGFWKASDPTGGLGIDPGFYGDIIIVKRENYAVLESPLIIEGWDGGLTSPDYIVVNRPRPDVYVLKVDAAGSPQAGSAFTATDKNGSVAVEALSALALGGRYPAGSVFKLSPASGNFVLDETLSPIGSVPASFRNMPFSFNGTGVVYLGTSPNVSIKTDIGLPNVASNSIVIQVRNVPTTDFLAKKYASLSSYSVPKEYLDAGFVLCQKDSAGNLIPYGESPKTWTYIPKSGEPGYGLTYNVTFRQDVAVAVDTRIWSTGVANYVRYPYDGGAEGAAHPLYGVVVWPEVPQDGIYVIKEVVTGAEYAWTPYTDASYLPQPKAQVLGNPYPLEYNLLSGGSDRIWTSIMNGDVKGNTVTINKEWFWSGEKQQWPAGAEVRIGLKYLGLIEPPSVTYDDAAEQHIPALDEHPLRDATAANDSVESYAEFVLTSSQASVVIGGYGDLGVHAGIDDVSDYLPDGVYKITELSLTAGWSPQDVIGFGTGIGDGLGRMFVFYNETADMWNPDNLSALAGYYANMQIWKQSYMNYRSSTDLNIIIKNDKVEQGHGYIAKQVRDSAGQLVSPKEAKRWLQDIAFRIATTYAGLEDAYVEAGFGNIVTADGTPIASLPDGWDTVTPMTMYYYFPNLSVGRWYWREVNALTGTPIQDSSGTVEGSSIVQDRALVQFALGDIIGNAVNYQANNILLIANKREGLPPADIELVATDIYTRTRFTLYKSDLPITATEDELLQNGNWSLIEGKRNEIGTSYVQWDWSIGPNGNAFPGVGWYGIKEDVAPQGYTKQDGWLDLNIVTQYGGEPFGKFVYINSSLQVVDGIEIINEVQIYANAYDIKKTFTFKVTKKDNEENLLDGAGFTLYNSNVGGDKGSAVGAEQITGLNGIVQWGNLVEGWYILSETTLPLGFSKAIPDYHFYISVSNTTNDVLEYQATNVPDTHISFTKFLRNGTSLMPASGITFELYKENDATPNNSSMWDGTDTLRGTSVSGVSGEVVFIKPEPGWYWLRETGTIPEGYVSMSPNPLHVDINADGFVNLTAIYNDAKLYNLQFTKKEQRYSETTGALLSPADLDVSKLGVGAYIEFKLYDSDGVTQIGSSERIDNSTDNVIRFEGLTHGRVYILKETHVPAGWSSGIPTQGIEISYPLVSAGVPYPENNGVREIIADPVVNTRLAGEINIVKYGVVGESRTPLQGAQFRLYRYSSYDTSMPVPAWGNGWVMFPDSAQVKESDIDGKVRWSNLPWGYYIVVEEATPSVSGSEQAWWFGSEVGDVIRIDSSLGLGNPSVQERDNYKRGVASIQKIATSHGQLATNIGAGFEFKLYRSSVNSDSVPAKSTFTQIGQTKTVLSNQGSVSWGGLEPGYYYIAETSRDGWINGSGWTGETPIFRVTTTMTSFSFIAQNVEIFTGTITIRKTDGVAGTGLYVGGAGFTLEKRSGVGPAYTWTAVGAEQFTNNVNYGNLSWSSLEYGVYRVRETTEPVNYVKIGSGISEDITISDTNLTPSMIYFQDVLDIGGIRVVKYDTSSNLPLDGAVFGVYRWTGTEFVSIGVETKTTVNGSAIWDIDDLTATYGIAGTMLYIFEESAPQGYKVIPKPMTEATATALGMRVVVADPIGSTATASIGNTLVGKIKLLKQDNDGVSFDAIRKARFELYSRIDGEYVYLRSAWTDDSGHIEWTQLKLEYDYWHKEVELNAATAGLYEFNSDYHLIRAVEEYTEDIPTVINTKILRNITISKRDSADESLIAGAVFGLYGSSYQLIEQRTTDDNGTIEWIGLTPGLYYVREISVPSPYQLPNPNNYITIDFRSNVDTGVVPANKYQIIYNSIVESGKIIVTKKDGSTLQALDGASFGLYTSNANNAQPVMVRLTGAGGTVGIVEFVDLERREYWVAEIQVPTGYDDSMLGQKYYINLGIGNPATVNMPTVFNYRNTGIGVVKRDSLSGITLNGAVYGLYDSNRIEIRRSTTSNSGTIFFDNVGFGVFYVREITAPPGYALDETWYPVELTSARTSATVEITDSKYGSIRIIKTGPNGVDRLQGAGFDLRRNNSLVAESVTDINGVIVFDNLEQGNYEIVEITAPAGYYSRNQIQQVTVGGYDSTVLWDYERVVQNDKQSGSLVVTKTDEQGARLSGAVFEITYPNGSTSRYTTNLDGRINLASLEYGTYTIREVYPPTGYYILTDWKNVYIDGVKEISFVNSKEVVKGNISINKTDEDGNPLSGVVYGIYRDGTLLRRGTSDRNGYILFDNLEDASYVIKEESTVDGYVLDTKETVVLIGNVKNYTFEFENERIKHWLVVEKIDIDRNVGLRGAEFMVNKVGSGVIKTITTDISGEFSLEVDTGVYEIVERVPPYGYISVLESTKVVIDDSSPEIVRVTVGNRYVPNDINFFKYDILNGSGLSGAVFSVFDETGEYELYSGVTSDNGLLGFELPIGKYMYQELTTPEGYIADTNIKYPFEIDGMGNKRIDVSNTKKAVPELPKTGSMDNVGKTLVKITIVILFGILLYGTKKISYIKN